MAALSSSQAAISGSAAASSAASIQASLAFSSANSVLSGGNTVQSSASSALSSATTAAQSQDITVESVVADVTPIYVLPSNATLSDVASANSYNLSVYSSAASSATSEMSSATSSLSSTVSSYSSAVISYNATGSLSNSAKNNKDSATLSTAESAFNSTTDTAILDGVNVGYSAAVVSPSYVSAASAILSLPSLWQMQPILHYMQRRRAVQLL